MFRIPKLPAPKSASYPSSGRDSSSTINPRIPDRADISCVKVLKNNHPADQPSSYYSNFKYRNQRREWHHHQQHQARGNQKITYKEVEMDRLRGRTGLGSSSDLARTISSSLVPPRQASRSLTLPATGDVGRRFPSPATGDCRKAVTLPATGDCRKAVTLPATDHSRKAVTPVPTPDERRRPSAAEAPRTTLRSKVVVPHHSTILEGRPPATHRSTVSNPEILRLGAISVAPRIPVRDPLNLERRSRRQGAGAKERRRQRRHRERQPKHQRGREQTAQD